VTIKIQLPKEVLNIIKIFEKNGFEIFIAGGAVRDILLGKIVYDWDFATNTTPEDMLKILKKLDAYYTNDFGTVGIPNEIEGERPYEITTFRSESAYSDFRRPDKIVWGKTIEEDLKRRDFTINAMAVRPISKLSGKSFTFDLIDIFNGQVDLKNKLIRAVGDAHERFSEDALRMMRAVRIAAELGFNIEENTLEALKANATLINKIAKERVREELFKILRSPFPYEGILIFRNVGLMQEILPEMEKTFGVEQKSPGRHHIYDVGTHSMLALKYCKSEDPVTRLATLIHDVGKPVTYKKNSDGLITFYNHEMVSANIAKNIAERLKFSRAEQDKFIRLVRWHQFSVDEHQTDSAIRRFIRNVGIGNISDMLALRVADRLGGGARETSWRLEEFKKRLIEVRKQPFTVHDLKVDGKDVMKVLKIKPGPQVGEILQKLFDEVVEKKIKNDKKELLKRLNKLR
jgi:tRNA nucleotidyltransferase (CCA-adding enzyme)